MSEIPQAAITAAADAIGAYRPKARDGWPAQMRDLARLALEAAAPHIRAAERERIRKLAQERLDALGADDFSPAAQLLADVLIITHQETGDGR